MNARHALAAVIITAIATSPSSASVLSASSQAVGTKSSKADYLQVIKVQNELNATMGEVNDAAVASGPLTVPAPETGQAGFILQEKEGTGGKSYGQEPFVQPQDDGLGDGRLMTPASTRGQSPSPYGAYDNNRRNMANSRRGGGNGRHGGGAHAAPEPSTWMLLGVGLALFGGYATLRRRAAFEN